ncbi:MAG: hypothetical protein M3Y31_03940, partial [Gemmatimonadota bacterium]|nr:hypothetical protein [Gemmatimonadota bacterium]
AWASVAAAVAARPAEPPSRQAAEPPVQAAEPPPSDPRPTVESVVASYATAVESRSTARIREVYPGLTETQEQDWRQFFEAVGEVQATLRVTDVQVTGDAAEAVATGEYVFANTTTRRTERQPATVRMTFRRAPDGAWRLTAIR